MADMADYRLGPKDPSRPTRTIWVTRNGQRIAIVDMSDVHLLNTICYLRRTGREQLMSATLSIAALNDDTEVPEDVWDACGNESDGFIFSPTWPRLLAEAARRGLKL